MVVAFFAGTREENGQCDGCDKAASKRHFLIVVVMGYTFD